MGITISKKTNFNLLKTAINNSKIDKDLFVQLIMHKVNGSYEMEYLLHLLYEPSAELVYPNDYVKVEPDSYNVDKKFNLDILKEMGLLSDDNMIYARIIKDDGWSSEYNPFYGRVKVAYLYHDKNNKLIEHQDSVSTSELVKVNKDDILYFKNLKDGKNIKITTQEGIEGLEESNENPEEKE